MTRKNKLTEKFTSVLNREEKILFLIGFFLLDYSFLNLFPILVKELCTDSGRRSVRSLFKNVQRKMLLLL